VTVVTKITDLVDFIDYMGFNVIQGFTEKACFGTRTEQLGKSHDAREGEPGRISIRIQSQLPS